MTPSVFVLRVLNVLPQVQVTWVSTYAGWMSAFMSSPSSGSLGRRPAGAVNQNRRHSLPRRGWCGRGPRVRRATPWKARRPMATAHSADGPSAACGSGGAAHLEAVGDLAPRGGAVPRDLAVEHPRDKLDGGSRDLVDVDREGGELGGDEGGDLEAVDSHQAHLLRHR